MDVEQVEKWAESGGTGEEESDGALGELARWGRSIRQPARSNGSVWAPQSGLTDRSWTGSGIVRSVEAQRIKLSVRLLASSGGYILLTLLLILLVQVVSPGSCGEAAITTSTTTKTTSTTNSVISLSKQQQQQQQQRRQQQRQLWQQRANAKAVEASQRELQQPDHEMGAREAEDASYRYHHHHDGYDDNQWANQSNAGSTSADGRLAPARTRLSSSTLNKCNLTSGFWGPRMCTRALNGHRSLERRLSESGARGMGYWRGQTGGGGGASWPSSHPPARSKRQAGSRTFRRRPSELKSGYTRRLRRKPDERQDPVSAASSQEARAELDRLPSTRSTEPFDYEQISAYHNLIEPQDDHLFLAPESLAERLAGGPPEELASGGRAGRPRRLVSEDKSQVQTIYFGGFFPWLLDDGSKVAGRSPAGRVFNPMLSPPLAMINGHHRGSDQVPSNVNNQLKPSPQRKQQQYENVTSPSSLIHNSETSHQLGRFILPAVRLALDHINNNGSVLGSYRLEIVARDTQCNATISLKEFFDMVYEEPKKMLLYGDACRVSTDPIAKASYFFDLIQISYADTDPIYTIENYPNFFRVVPSENALSLARIPFIRHFNWTRVGTIYQNLPRYSLPHSKLLTDLERYNIVIKQSVSLPGSVDGLQDRDLGDELRKLKEKDVRIILGNFDEEWALLLFCEAFRETMTGRKYQWILTGVSENKLWQHYRLKGSSCSEQELLIAMDGYITTDITPVTRSQQRTISGLMAHEYSNEYKHRAQEMNIAIEDNKFYGYVYDGIWAIAMALHRVDSQLKYYNGLVKSGKRKLNPEIEGITSLLDFDYNKPVWVKLIRNALNKTRFSGVTGTVSFHKNERPGLISFSQFQTFRDMNEVIIGSYDALEDHLDLKVGFPIFWRGSSPPIDYTIQRVTPFRINRTLFVIISILSLFGIVLAFIFLFINIKFRNQRYIKMSSPYLNNLIIIGCILTYTSVIILGLDSGLTSEYNFPYICNARAWVLMAGFTLAFGSMFSKTFRVHSIFTNIKLHKKVIKDYKLFMVVFILLTFDICILIVWQYFDPFYRETNNGTSIQDSDNEDVIIVPEMEHCQSKRMTIFLSVIYVYKGLLMAFGCFLAWETRHVSIPALNDSKYIGLSVYNVVIMCVIGASLSFVLRDQQDASFVIISIFIIFCSTTTLCLVFVPKLIELKQNPRAGDQRVRATLKTFKKNYAEEALGASTTCRDIHGNLIGRGHGANLNEKIKLLFEENTKQRTVLKEKTYELEALTYKYKKIQSMIQSGQYIQALNTTAGASKINLTLLHSPSTPMNKLPTSSQSQIIDKVSSSALDGDKSGNLVTGLSQVTEISDKFDLRKSPPISSSIQITSNNITCSTNSNSDFDYSFSKVVSNQTTSTNCFSGSSTGQSKCALVTFDCLQNEKKKNQCNPTRFSPNKDETQNNSLVSYTHDSRNKKNPSPNRPLIGSFPTGVDYKLRFSGKSLDDSNSFAVFSYRHDKKQSKYKSAEYNFSRWSEGPFCTLMIRNHDQQVTNAPRAVKYLTTVEPYTKKIDRERSIQSKSPTDKTRVSCPDMTSIMEAKLKLIPEKRLRKPRKQTSHHIDKYETRASAFNLSKSRLPRTMSMIEYLGLNEFELIAKRHDKLIRCRQNKIDNHDMISCACCMVDKQNIIERCQMQSLGDMFSSNDPLNSAELLYNISRLSCSTCCSLASHSYTSQSDILGTTRSSQSISSQTTSSSLSVCYGKQKYLSISQSSSQSSSANNQQQQLVHCCPIHQHHHSSDPESVSSSSSSIKPTNNDERSLCTTGVLYYPPGNKEDANNSAQIVQNLSQSSPSEAPTERAESVPQKKLSIKCDIMEDL